MQRKEEPTDILAKLIYYIDPTGPWIQQFIYIKNIKKINK